MKNKIGIPQWCYPGKGMYCMEMAKELNFDIIQLDLGCAEDGYPLMQPFLQKKMVADAVRNQVEVVAISVNVLCKRGFVKPDGREHAYRDLVEAVNAAKNMGVSAITIPSFFDNAIEDKCGFDETVRALSFICNIALEYDIDVYTENVLKPIELYHLFDEVNMPNLKLLFDSQNYHVVKGYNSSEILEEIYDKVDIGEFLHLKDGVGQMSNRFLGEGDSEVGKCIEVLKRKNFQGGILLENSYQLLGNTAEYRKDNLLAVKYDIGILKSLFL